LCGDNTRDPNNSVPEKYHFNWDSFANGWYVDPSQLCSSDSDGCTKNADGSYDLRMLIEFQSQRWFYVGAVVSVLALFICILFISLPGRRIGGTWHRRK
jgi:hypothetical protein